MCCLGSKLLEGKILLWMLKILSKMHWNDGKLCLRGEGKCKIVKCEFSVKGRMNILKRKSLFVWLIF